VSASGTFDNRFVLRFTSSALTTSSAVFNENSVIVYQQNGSIYINTGLESMNEVQVFDVRGSLLYSKNNISSSDLSILNLASSQQILLVTIKSIDGKIVTKKIVF
jgi:hypothetical protein